MNQGGMVSVNMDTGGAKSKKSGNNWKSMLQKTNELVSQIPLDSAGIPALQRDPAQLQAAAQSLLSKRPEVPSDSKALRLLGQYSFDADKLERDLQQIVPAKEVSEVEQYEDHIHQIFATAIDETMDATITESEIQAARLIEEDWAAERQTLLDELEHEGNWKPPGSDKENTSDNARLLTATPFTPHYMQVQSVVPQTTVKPVSVTDTKMNIYLNTLEKARGKPKTESLLQGILDSNRDFAAENHDVNQLWELTRCIVEDKSLGGRRFLEQQYLRFIERQVEAGSREHKGKLTLDTLSLIRNWLKLAKKMPGLGALSESLNYYSNREDSIEEPIETSSGLPLWAVVYHCMRCGAWKTALSLLQGAQKKSKILASENCLVEGLTTRVNSDFADPIDDKVLANIKSVHDLLQSGQRSYDNVATPSNPWKRAVFQLLAADASDSLDRSVNASIQDFLWFKLGVAISPNNRAYTKAHIAQVVLRNGPEHFNGRQNPYLYARILMLCGENEQAISFLALSSKACETEAVHLALALKELGLIQVEEASQAKTSNALVLHTDSANSSADELLIQGDSTKGEPTLLVLGRLVQRYVSRFVYNNPKAAVLYLLELRPAQDTIEYLKALLLETGNFKDLLDGGESDYTSDFMHCSGILFQLLPDDINVCFCVIQEAARMAQARGQMFTAVQLFLRGGAADSWNEAVALMNSQLVQVLVPPNEMRAKWKQLAKMVAGQREIMSSLQSDRVKAFEQLQKLLQFYDNVKSKRWPKALDEVSWLLPTKPAEVESCLSQYRYLDATVRQAFPLVFETAVQAVWESFAGARQTSNTARMAQLKEQFAAYVHVFSALPIQTSALAQLIASIEVKLV